MTPLTSGVASDGASVAAFVDRVTARVTWIAAAQGAAAGLVLAALIMLVAVPAGSGSRDGALPFTLSHAFFPAAITVLCALTGASMQIARTTRTTSASAQLIERGAPSSRNVIFTANELARASADATPDASRVEALVCAEADRVVATLDLSALVPARRPLVALTIGVASVALVAARDSAPLRDVARVARSIAAPGVPRIDEIVVTVTPPSYANQAPTMVRNPSRVEALTGSRLSMRVLGRADSLRVETARGVQRVGRDAGRAFQVTLAAETDGFIALTPFDSAERDGLKRLVGLTVNPDHAPRVRITAPTRDLFVRDSAHVIDLAIESGDDLALESLRLRYTKVSGSGERFTFTDGEVPLALTRGSDRAWTARARWPLAPLGLSRGDMVVYRAVATDRRPGSVPQESDALIAEIVAIGGDAVAGFAIDPDQERYAVSQQMIVIKTERLIARRASMPPDSLTRASQELAAEQRKVRAEFVFMMGGELADEPDPDADMNDLNEEAEAEAEDDILAGRLENRGRMALMRAIRAMSRAATELTNVQLTSALALEKSAVTQLEMAFARTRILLRALSQRETLDETRRLTGQLADARSDRRAVPSAAIDPRQVALRRALADLADPGRGDRGSESRRATGSRPALSLLAESVLRIDPSDVTLQVVARQLSDASRAVSGNSRDNARALLDSAVVALADVARQTQPRAGSGGPSFTARLLRGAIVDRGKTRKSIRNGKRDRNRVPRR